jgi:hypothetical protein
MLVSARGAVNAQKSRQVLRADAGSASPSSGRSGTTVERRCSRTSHQAANSEESTQGAAQATTRPLRDAVAATRATAASWSTDRPIRSITTVGRIAP